MSRRLPAFTVLGLHLVLRRFDCAKMLKRQTNRDIIVSTLNQDGRTWHNPTHQEKHKLNLNASRYLEASYAHVATKADIADVRTEVAKVRTEIADLRTELKTDIANLRTEVKTDIANLRTEVRTDIANLRTEVISEIGDLATSVNTDIGTLRTDMKNMRWIIAMLMAAASIFITAANVLVSLALRT